MRYRATALAPGRAQHDVVEHRSVRAGLAEQPEHQRHCGVGHFVEHLQPAQLGQRGVELLTGGRRHRLAQAVFQ